jgi:hypothetical protein
VIKILIKIFENILQVIKNALSLHRFSGKQLLKAMRKEKSKSKKQKGV